MKPSLVAEILIILKTWEGGVFIILPTPVYSLDNLFESSINNTKNLQTEVLIYLQFFDENH
jgi:hypothetical protein